MIHRLLSVLGSSAALILSAGSAHADDEDDGTAGLSPSSEWKLREYDDKCRMSRTFGKGEERTTLWLDKGGPGPGINVTVIGNTVRNPYGAMIETGFLPGEMLERNYITSESSKGRPVIALFGVQPNTPSVSQKRTTEAGTDDGEETVDLTEGTMSSGPDSSALPQTLRTIGGLRLARAVRMPIELDFGDFSAAADELMECTEKLTDRLGKNSYVMQGLRKPALPDRQEEWARKIQANYPYHLLRKREEGAVHVRLTVNAKGRATYCEVTQYSGPASFNDTACLLMLRHARFNPATDAEGSPVPAFYSTRIIYDLR